jgi:Holliday junction resolvase-like predicted endonuclease
MKLKKINIREREELEPIVIKDPEIIENGLKIITHQLMTDSGPLDILAVDSDNALVIIELKAEAVESHIDQGLRYYDWCNQNISWIANAYKSYKINPETKPRLILVSPAYTENVKRIAKYIDVDLQLYEYIALENENNERTIVCKSIDFGQQSEPTIIPTIEKKLEYFKDEKVKKLFENVLDNLKNKGIEIKPIKDLWISFWYKNKRFMYMSPKQNFFIIEVLTLENTWAPRIRINNEKDWEENYKLFVEKYIDFLDNK